MQKYIISILFSFIVLASVTGSAMAHTGLESSEPSEGAVLTEQLQEITLTFEGKIEKTSSFSLLNENGEEVPVTNLAVADHLLTGSVDSLDNGAYTIEWNIIGADGHPIKGTIHFMQDAVVSETATETPAEEAVIEDEPVAEQSESATADVEEDSSNVWIYVVSIVLIVAILAFFLRSRKK